LERDEAGILTSQNGSPGKRQDTIKSPTSIYPILQREPKSFNS
jgi:hypothetical protein